MLRLRTVEPAGNPPGASESWTGASVMISLMLPHYSTVEKLVLNLLYVLVM